MVHSKIFGRYKKMFYMDAPNVKVWYPNGFNSIRIRLFNKDEFVFSYTKDDIWNLETLDNFIETLITNKINGGNKK